MMLPALEFATLFLARSVSSSVPGAA